MAKDKKPEEYGYRFVKCERGFASADECNTLAKKWRETQDPVLRERLIVRARGLVGMVQAEYSVPPFMQRRDLIGEGFKGLIQFTDNYKGDYNFVHYAIKYIHKAIKRYIARNIKLIPLKLHSYKIVRSTPESKVPLGEDPKLDNLRRIKQGKEISLGEIPRERIVTDRDTLQALIEEEEREKAHERMEATLDEREKEILFKLYGVPSESAQPSLEEVGAEIGISKERVRQIKNEAISSIQGNLCNAR